MNGSVEALRFLLDAGVAVDAVDPSGCTALLCSITDQNAAPEQIISMLVAAGASVDARDRDGRSITDRLKYIKDEEKRATFARALSASPKGRGRG